MRSQCVPVWHTPVKCQQRFSFPSTSSLQLNKKFNQISAAVATGMATQIAKFAPFSISERLQLFGLQKSAIFFAMLTRTLRKR